MSEPKRYLITAALPYANGQKHVGHLAGAYLPADIYVRYLRAQKRDVVFVCGSDEHGTAIPIQAMKEGTTPQAIIDKYHVILEQNFKDLFISFDVYDRTSSPLHHDTAQEFFTYLNDRGDLEVKETEQYFDEQAQTFLADRYIKGTCPNCGFEGAFGDQCERCGTSLSPDELINPVSTLSGASPIKKWTKHWYLPLNKHEDWLRNWILNNHAGDWKGNVLGQCKSWIDAGLQPRAVTRDLDWGVKVPTPPLPPEGEILEESYRYETADPALYGLLKDFVKTHRSRPTQAEDILWQALRENKLEGYKFRRQHIIGSYIADFICLTKRLIIEVDGLIHQLPENKASDKDRTAWLTQKGYEVIGFTNDEVLFNTDTTLKKILQKLNDLPHHETSSKIPPSGGGGAKVLYVWFDAPIGYISATKQWALNNGKDWKPYWTDKETKLVHFVGKDNIVFHCIIFPVMLKLHNYIVPENVPANEFMNLEGSKMSTSRTWKLDMQDFIDDFIKAETGGPSLADALRYYLTTILPETKDSEFTWKGFGEAVNSELVAIFGNFVNRTFVLMHKLCGGKVPKFHKDGIDEKDKALLQEISAAPKNIEPLLEHYKFRDALYEIIDLARKGNKYLQEKEPWIKAKGLTGESGQMTAAQQSIDNTLHICLQLCANLAIFINPFLPNTAKKLCSLMKVVDKMLDWENGGKTNLLSVGYSLRAPELLFRKIEDEEIEHQIQKLKKSLQKSMDDQNSSQLTVDGSQPAANQPEIANLKSEIQYDDFEKLDLRIGTITTAEKVEKADKLLKLTIDLGFEQRTIVSGIAPHFTPESLINKQVLVVANLAPRKMRGIVSQGMILTAEQPDGKLILVHPDALTLNGSTVR